MSSSPLEQLESAYPRVAIHCHELVDATRAYLLDAAARITHQAAATPLAGVTPAFTRTLAEYYAKLHTVAAMPAMFLSVARAVWSATDDLGRGLWAIEVVETALAVALDPVAVAAVNAGRSAAGDEFDAKPCEPRVVEGVQLVAAAVFDTALALVEK